MTIYVRAPDRPILIGGPWDGQRIAISSGTREVDLPNATAPTRFRKGDEPSVPDVSTYVIGTPAAYIHKPDFGDWERVTAAQQVTSSAALIHAGVGDPIHSRSIDMLVDAAIGEYPTIRIDSIFIEWWPAMITLEWSYRLHAMRPRIVLAD